ncbi:MAG TPA: NAD(+) synthase [Candidatus Woesebacteria bacterium]|nr:NAD(+) synthase [Candidatus Woesebacteria bacterium]
MAEITQRSIIKFVRLVLKKANRERVIIGISGGVDSSVVLALLTKTLPKEAITPVFLPYQDQDMTDAYFLCEGLGFETSKCLEINIGSAVQKLADLILQDSGSNNENENQSELAKRIRLGNMMARVRMIVLFDLAAANNALVVGTENRSENLLGYFTRFGDAASDLEPIAHLYKTQVMQLAEELELPKRLLFKPPSAELWVGQTDEAEMGFTYQQADSILMELELQARQSQRSLIEQVGEELTKISDQTTDPSQAMRAKVLQRVKQNWFKQEVSYKMNLQ